jgi:hypothetical protein
MHMATSKALSSMRTPVSASTRRWIVAAARFGYLAKAMVYAIIGLLAMLAAAHSGKHIAGSHGAFMVVLGQPLGRMLLGILAAGLGAYALWRLTQAVLDTDRRGNHAKGILARLGMLCTGLIYAGLAYSALRIFLGLRSMGSDDQQARSWTALLMSKPFGRWLVAAAGAAVVAVALHEVYVVYRGTFARNLQLSKMSPKTQRFIVRCAQIGHSARAIVFGIIGGFLLEAAVYADARQAKGLGGALHVLEREPYGDWLLAAVATGFLAYAAYLLLLMIYRRIV